ncbi:MAG: GGDEF domain-containing protein, partial [Clostridia bacterium]|nr:GGDEF domain-containing protein [Clostridia bacterium]
MVISNIKEKMDSKMRNLKGFLIYGAVIGTIIMLLLVYVGVSFGFQWYAAQQAAERAKKTAAITADSLYLLMERGWSREELQAYLMANSDAYREQHVSVAFYDIHELEKMELTEQVMANGKEGHSFLDSDKVSFLYPQIATAECVSCHVDTQEGKLVGVLMVTEDLQPVMQVVRRDTFFYLLFLFPFPIMGAFAISRFLTGRIDRSLRELHSRIQRINKTDDLRYLETNNIDLAFDEINFLYRELRNLAQRLRSIAVDKDILEFEVRLLEKFIITSEVVKDWKEHVNRLIIEINQIVDVHVIFSLFKVESEDFILEVFWLYTPSEKTKKIVEEVIRAQLSSSELFRTQENVALRIYHNVAVPEDQLMEIDESKIRFQTKSLFLDTPQIGGIVGIGVSSRLQPDSTRMLVIEGVLTTLLNVIGSVKAVYKYTKELEYFATRDALTNLYTQRVFWELLEYEVGRAERRDYKFAVIIIDLDDFKLVNDLHGHLIGDKFLQETAAVIKNCLRKDDILARYGGDEYAIILPYADQEQA